MNVYTIFLGYACLVRLVKKNSLEMVVVKNYAALS